MAWRGMARLGLVRLGLVGQGKVFFSCVLFQSNQQTDCNKTRLGLIS